MIVAFLQNAWVRDPARLEKMFAQQDEQFRRRMLASLLFMGCVTGRRLKSAFGEELCDAIVWEETTRVIAGDPKTILPAQPEHIRAVLNELKPAAVLALGAIAAKSVFAVMSDCQHKAILITAPHPAARQADVMQRLRDAGKQLWFHR